MCVKIICGQCGITENGPNGTWGHVYFPNRMVYFPDSTMPHHCLNCGAWQDMVIFGTNYVSGVYNFDILKYPEVIENNIQYNNSKPKNEKNTK